MTPPSSARRHFLLALDGRSGLPYRQIHGAPLYAHALRALAEVGGPVMVAADKSDLRRVREEVKTWGFSLAVFGDDEWWDYTRASGAELLVHDALCPLIPADFLRSVLHRADEQPQQSIVAFRPITDTLKAVVDERILGTIDRERLVAIASPILVSSEIVVREVGTSPPPVHDFAEIVPWLRQRGEVELLRAPSLGRRVEHARAVHLLECMDEVARRVRAEPGHPASVAEDRT